jgi:ribonuclease-3
MDKYSLKRFFDKYNSDRIFRDSLKKILGFKPGKLEVYQLAFTHRSIATMLTNGLKNSNERLEFLGDAVLSALVAKIVYFRYPDKNEGFLTEMRSKLVNRSYLNNLAEKMNLGSLLNYDSRHFQKSLPKGSVLGDALEALIGAIYIDKGIDFASKFYYEKIWVPYIDLDSIEKSQINFKSKLMEWGQKNGKEIYFTPLESDLVNKGKFFEIKVLIDSQEMGYGKDLNKKTAEKIAAEKTCGLLKI